MKRARAAVEYAESRQYTEPLFVFVIMVVAASRPVLEVVGRGIVSVAGLLPGRSAVTRVWLGFTQAYERHQHPLVLKEGLLVGFFLAGLVVLGGMQQWWVQPIISGLEPLQLFFGALPPTLVAAAAFLIF